MTPDFNVLLDTVLAFIVPFVAAFLLRNGYAPTIKVLVALALCALAALARTYFEGKLDLQNFTSSAMYIFTVGQVFYAKYGKELTGGIELNLGNTDPKPEEPAQPEQPTLPGM